MKIDQIMAISPIDGRYASKVTELQPIWSEYGLNHHRLLVEIRWLQCLARQKLITLSATDNAFLNRTLDTFSEKGAQNIKQIEKQTKHDIKAVEYFLKQKCKSKKSLLSILEFIHFGCTSDDINNLAYALMIKQTRDNYLLPQLNAIISPLQALAHRYADISMLSRTHGQPATPTTLGKEFANFAARLKTQQAQLKSIKIQGKFNGATGNYSAAAFAYPNIAHSYWENFHLTGEFYVRQAKAPKF